MKPCSSCGVAEHVRISDEGPMWIAYCDNCYDCDCVGDPPRYVALTRTAWGRTREDAIHNWNEDE